MANKFTLYLATGFTAHIDINCINTTFAACLNAARTHFADPTLMSLLPEASFAILETGSGDSLMALPALTMASDKAFNLARLVLIRTDFFATDPCADGEF